MLQHMHHYTAIAPPLPGSPLSPFPFMKMFSYKGKDKHRVRTRCDIKYTTIFASMLSFVDRAPGRISPGARESFCAVAMCIRGARASITTITAIA